MKNLKRRIWSVLMTLAMVVSVTAGVTTATEITAQAAEHDKLDDLLAFSRQFDNIIIQE